MCAEQKRFEHNWELLLSREPIKILAAYRSLLPDERSAVQEHLEKMVSEPGWQPGQRISARAALDAIPKE